MSEAWRYIDNKAWYYIDNKGAEVCVRRCPGLWYKIRLLWAKGSSDERTASFVLDREEALDLARALHSDGEPPWVKNGSDGGMAVLCPSTAIPAGARILFFVKGHGTSLKMFLDSSAVSGLSEFLRELPASPATEVAWEYRCYHNRIKIVASKDIFAECGVILWEGTKRLSMPLEDSDLRTMARDLEKNRAWSKREHGMFFRIDRDTHDPEYLLASIEAKSSSVSIWFPYSTDFIEWLKASDLRRRAYVRELVEEALEAHEEEGPKVAGNCWSYVDNKGVDLQVLKYSKWSHEVSSGSFAVRLGLRPSLSLCVSLLERRYWARSVGDVQVSFAPSGGDVTFSKGRGDLTFSRGGRSEAVSLDGVAMESLALFLAEPYVEPSVLEGAEEAYASCAPDGAPADSPRSKVYRITGSQGTYEVGMGLFKDTIRRIAVLSTDPLVADIHGDGKVLRTVVSQDATIFYQEGDDEER